MLLVCIGVYFGVLRPGGLGFFRWVRVRGGVGGGFTWEVCFVD